MDTDERLVLAQRIRTVSKAQAAMVDQSPRSLATALRTIAVHHVDNHAAANEVARR